MEKTFYPGTRVMVFDYSLFKDDKSTPLSVTVKPATVVRWYGQDYSNHPAESMRALGNYPSLIDVDFDHRGLSRGHFTTFVENI